MIETFGEGKYLTGKTAIVTGGNSGIGYIEPLLSHSLIVGIILVLKFKA